MVRVWPRAGLRARGARAWKLIGTRTALKPRAWMRYMTVKKSCVTALGPCHRPLIMEPYSKPHLRGRAASYQLNAHAVFKRRCCAQRREDTAKRGMAR